LTPPRRRGRTVEDAPHASGAASPGGGPAPVDAVGPETLRARVLARARALGFARAGVAAAGPLGVEAERLRAWVAEGMHAGMRYMAESLDDRCDPTRPGGLLPGARSVIALAMPYARAEARVGPAPGRIARYARGRDYHNVVLKRARKLAAWLRTQGFSARATCDAMPMMERAWAERAGLGFIGKNACLIVPGLGSHVLLATVLTDAPLPPDAPMPERCGACTLCLDACPTRAFAAPRRLDARRCISYLTIEHEGPIDPALRPAMGDWVLGCDACQDVCPYNRTALPPDAETAPFAPDPRWAEHDAERLLGLDALGFAAAVRGTPAARPGRDGMRRNLLIALGNAGTAASLPTVEALAAGGDAPAVVDAARWAAERLAARGQGARDASGPSAVAGSAPGNGPEDGA
jgi:epoxyqueuosine reductase